MSCNSKVTSHCSTLATADVTRNFQVIQILKSFIIRNVRYLFGQILFMEVIRYSGKGQILFVSLSETTKFGHKIADGSD